MNKIYRIVWNRAVNAWVVASEFATQRRVGGAPASAARRLWRAPYLFIMLTGGVITFIAPMANATQANTYEKPLCTSSADCKNIVVAHSNANNAAVAQNNRGWSFYNNRIDGQGPASDRLTLTNYGVAIGESANAGDAGIALGSNSKTSILATAIGAAAEARGASSLAIGGASLAEGTDNIAVGRMSYTKGESSMALGKVSTATGDRAMAFGHSSNASGQRAIAIGNPNQNAADSGTPTFQVTDGNTQSSGADAVAIGTGAVASGDRSTALGDLARASGTQSTALGENSKASNENATALGSNASSSGKNAIASGVNSAASGDYSIAMGNDSAASKENSIAIGSGSNASNTNTVAVGSNAVASAADTSAFGDTAKATNDSATAVGDGSEASGKGSTATGYKTVASGLHGTALGYKAASSGAYSLAAGDNAQAKAQDAIAIGPVAVASGQESMALGSAASAANTKSIALGADSSSSADNAVAMGMNSSAKNADSVALGSNSVANRDGMNGNKESYSGTAVSSSMSAVSVGDSGKERQITNVAGGTQDTDAVNLRQLKYVGKNVTDSLGGGAAYNDNGNFTAPSYAMKDGTYNNVGDALKNADGRITNNATSINNLNNGKAGMVQQQGAGQKITVGKDTDGTVVDFADKNNGTRTLTNLKDGKIANGSTDAIDGGQLYNNASSVASSLGGGSSVSSDGSISKPVYNIGGKNYTGVEAGLRGVNDGAVKYVRDSNGNVDKTQVKLGDGNNGTTMTNLNAGGTGQNSKDAINGSQLYATNNQMAKSLGGGAKVDPNTGAVTGPTYTVHNADGSTTNVSNVGDALTNVDNRTVNNTTAINDLNSGKTGLTQQAAAGEKITVGKDTDGTSIDIADKNSNARTLDNLANGKVASDSKQGINGSQLYAGNQSIANAFGGGAKLNDDGTVAPPSYSVHNADGSTTSANNVGDALTNVDNHAVSNTNAINNLNSGKAGLVQQSSPTNNLTVGKDTGGSAVDFGDQDGNARSLLNVNSGAVSANSTDGINGSQLYNSANSVAQLLGGGASVNSDGSVSQPNYNIGGQTFSGVEQGLDGVYDGAVKYDRNSNGTVNKSKATLGDGNSGTTLTNLNNGNVAAGSKDAVTGDQLNTEQTQRQTANKGLADALGGGASVADDGTVTQPTYAMHNADGSTTNANNVGDALSNVDGRTVNNTNAINDINSGKAGLTQQAGPGEKITVGKDTDGTEVSYADKSGNTRKLTSVTDGTVSSSSKDAINGSQLYAGNQSVANALGGGSKVNDDGTVSQPSYTTHNADGSTSNANNVGDALTNVDNHAVNNTNAINDINSGKTGLTQQAGPGEKITVGKDTDGTEVSYADKSGNTRKLTNVTDGTISADSKDAINGSQLNTEQTQRQTANKGLADSLGGGASVADDGTVTQPTYAMHNADGSTTNANNVGDALSNVDGRTVNNTNAINDINSGKTGLTQQAGPGEKITVGKDTDGTEVSYADKSGNTRKLTNVTDGTVSSSSKDAINGSQLYAGNQSVANALGGGSKVNDDGTVSQPSYTTHNADGSTSNANNVGDALTNVDNHAVNNTNAINDINSGKTGLTQQAGPGEKITVGKDTDGTEVSYADKSGNTRKLTNVTDGTISSDSKDAVNGSQLNTEQTQRQTATKGLADSLGGGASVADDGTVTQPTYAMHNADGSTTNANNVGDALSNVDGRTVNNTNAINDINSGKTGLTQQAGPGEKITVGKDTDGTSIDIADKNSNARTLDNLANGKVASDSKQGVNGSQLYAGNQSVANALGGGSKLNDDGTVTQPVYNVNGQTFNGVEQGLAGVNDGAVKYDRNPNGTVNKSKATLGDGNSGTTLTNLNNGNVAAGSKDAVTGDQLNTEQTQRQTATKGLADSLGGGASVADDGTVTQPTYAMHNADGSTTNANNVGDALSNVDGRTVNNTNAINDINSGKTGLTQQAGPGEKITVGKDTDGTEVSYADKSGNTRKLTNVTDGTVSSSSKDAINGSQLYAGNQSVANALGGGSKVNDDGTVSQPSYTTHNADGSTSNANNVGDALTNVDNHAVNNTNAINDINSGKTGLTQQAGPGEKITVGKDTDGTEVSYADKSGNTRKLTNVTDGTISSDSKDAINGSQLNTEQTQRQTANKGLADSLGGGASVADDGTVTQPTYAMHNADGSTTNANNVGDALSNVDGRTVNNTNAINDINSGKTGLTQQAGPGEKITVGKDTDGTEVSYADKSGNTRKLTSVTDGTISADSKDAINGSQLNTEQTQRQTANKGLADSLGGGASVADDGTVTQPTYAMHNADGSTTNANNVGDALSNVDGRTVNNTNAINDINSGKTGLTQQAAAGEKITVGKDTDGTEVSYADKSGNTRKLTNVTDGTVSSSSKDAINGSQLYAGNQSVANALGGGSKLNDDGTVTQPVYNVNGQTFNGVEQGLAGVNDGAVKYDRNADGTVNKSKATLGDGNSGTTLTNLNNGNVAAGSKDAVTGDQLNTEQTQRQTANKGLADALGGGASVADDGTVTQPTYAMHNADGSTTNANNVGDALSNVDGRTVNNTNAINDINSGKTGLTQQAGPGEKITVGKDTDGTEVSYADKSGNTRKLTSVTDGTISSDSKDAINGSQLYAGNQSIVNALGGGTMINPDGTISQPKYTINGKDYNNAGDAFTALGQGSAVNSDSGNASATGDKSSATGAGSNASGAQSTANGDKAQATGDQATANGANTDASGKGSTATGEGAKATGDRTTATGQDSQATGKDGTATGAGSKATGDNSTASGADSTASGAGATANGHGANASGTDATALGKDAQATGDKSTALGSNAKADNANAVALGDGSTTDRDNSVSVGSAGNERQITNVADGTQDHDAMTVGQGRKVTDALGAGAGIDPVTGEVKAPSYQLHTYDQHTGQQPAATYNNVGDALNNLDGRTLTNTDQIREMAARVNPAGQYGYSINGRNFDRVEEAMQDIDSGAIKYDRDSNGKIDTSSAKLEGANGTRLSNLTAGNVTQNSTDAVNGSQLYTTNAKMAESLGGGASVDPNTGAITGPTYALHNLDGSATSANNVGDALTNLDGRTLSNTNAINDISSGKTGLTQQAGPGEKITVGKDTDGTEVSYADKSGNTRKLTSVSDGAVSATSKEAVNGSQLHAGNQSIANALGGGTTVNPDGTVSNPTYSINGKDYNNAGDAFTALGKGSAVNSDSANASATGANSAATGAGTNASGAQSTATGDKAQATGDQSTATGANTNASGKGATANGHGAKAAGDRTTATGQDAQATGKDGTATGAGSKATGDNSTATGADANASGAGATASGHGAQASGNQSSAFGQNANASGSNSIALGSGSTTRNADGSSRDNTVSVGSEGNERTISNVAPGTQRNDAATVGQMQDGLNEAGRRLDKVDRHAKAGAASAIAMTGLPQAVLPGRNLVSAAAGAYEGQSAVAVGLSTVSDNGRWVVKGQVSGNTQGSVGGALGVGYQW